MSSSKRFLIAVLVVGSALLLLQSGCCTMAGTVIGSIHDDRQPKQKPRQGWELAEIKPGTKVWATLSDSSRIEGRLSGILDVDHDFVAARYGQLRERDSETALLPAIGDSVSILPVHANWLQGRLKGVYYRRDGSEWHFCLAVARPDPDTLSECRLDQIAALRTSNGDVLAGKRLAGLICDSGGVLPIGAIEIATDIGTRKVFIEDIAHLSVPNHKHGLLTGALIGIVLDAAIISVGLAFQESMEWGN